MFGFYDLCNGMVWVDGMVKSWQQIFFSFVLDG